MNRNNPPPLINIWTIIGALVFAGILLLITLIAIGWIQPHQSGTVGFTPADLTILAPPTATVNAPTATPGGTVTPVPGQIAVGGYVQITGTGGDGLRIRSAAGLNSDTVFRGEESETFVVQNGPQQADGYTWWYVVAPYDKTRAGWAAANYLAAVPSP
jgi:hypothetical protein